VSRKRLVRSSLAAAALGFVLLVLGLLVDPRRTWFAYLAGWTFMVSVPIGALILLMTGHAAKASWMVVTRRLSESVAGLLPLGALLFVPLCFALSQVYPWVHHPDPHKGRYLSPGFFIARSALYFAVFVTIGALLRRWSRENDERPSMARVHRMRALSSAGLPLIALTLTWASFDWTMSLDPAWSSTIFGLYFFAGAFVGAIALVAMMLNLVRLGPAGGAKGAAGAAAANLPGSVRVTGDHAQALGRVLFAMIIFWAYMAFSQLLIYWIGDLPDEVTFYGLRTYGTWTALTYLLACGHFVVPFFLLLNRRHKRRPEYLAAVSAWIFFMHYVDIYWLVLPVCDRLGMRPHWSDFGAALFFGGLSCAWIVRRYASAAPLPLHDPALARGLEYEAAV
jgi:hypothetical protein